MTLPVPSQVGHSPPSGDVALPPQVGQMFSPVPGVPGGASSPGLMSFDVPAAAISRRALLLSLTRSLLFQTGPFTAATSSVRSALRP